MTAQLTIHNAQITTATVEIKTLTISGKQVTLAVFRQLQEAGLITAEGDLRGVPWGRVNYHTDKVPDAYYGSSRPVPCTSEEAAYSSHLHVVWQAGSELRRALVAEPRAGRQFRPTRKVWDALWELPQLFIAV
jgi:hypothetical protein